MDFGEYPTINVNFDERIKFVMRVVSSQQSPRLGVYIPIFIGESNEISEYSLKPCTDTIKVQASERKKCDISSESTYKVLDDTECQGYKTLAHRALFLSSTVFPNTGFHVSVHGQTHPKVRGQVNQST